MANCPHCKEAIEDLTGFVTKTRFDQVYGERKTFLAEKEELTGALEEATKNGADTAALTSQLASAQADLVTSKAQYETYATVTGAGFTDPSVVAGIELAYGRLPTEGRATLAEVIARWKTTPTEAPGLLQPHFAAAALGAATTAAETTTTATGEAAAATTTTAAATTTRPAGNIGVVTTPLPASTVKTAQDIAGMSIDEMRVEMNRPRK